MTLSGWFCSAYTGGLTVNAGTLDYSGATFAGHAAGVSDRTDRSDLAGGDRTCPYTINGGTLNIGGLSASIGAF